MEGQSNQVKLMKFLNSQEILDATNDGVISEADMFNYAKYREKIFSGKCLTNALDKFANDDLLAVQKKLVRHFGYHHELAYDALQKKASTITGEKFPVVTGKQILFNSYCDDAWYGHVFTDTGESIDITITESDLQYL